MVDASLAPFNSPTSVAIPGAVSLPNGQVGIPALRFTPEGWRDYLSKRLADRWSDVAKYDAYYRGHHNLAFASEKFRSAFGTLFSTFADNWTPIVVDAVQERLAPQGFRFGDQQQGDKDAWKIWQVNQLDRDAPIAHTEALIASVAYGLVAPPMSGQDVAPPMSGQDVAQITIEHAQQTIVATSPGNRRQRVAALKQWLDDTGQMMATLYLPDAIYKWQSRSVIKDSSSKIDWVERRGSRSETWPMKNPFGVVPVVPLHNRPRLLHAGESELAGVLPIQDAVNKLVADMLIASEFASFRQRWVTGMDIAVDETTNQPKAPFKPAVDRIWQTENPQARFGEFSVTDLSNYTGAIEMLVQHVASETRTPPHYFYLSGQFPSGESIKSAETGLVAKARAKMLHFGEGWEEIMRLAFSAVDDPRADIIDAEMIWGDPESRTESEHVDAILKKQALNVPDQQLWEDLGYTPQQIQRFKTMRAQDALQGLLAPPAPIPGIVRRQEPVAPPVV